ncbi:MAG TPA: hypothetical protein VI039_05045 [Solirubrobacterales bacterium]
MNYKTDFGLLLVVPEAWDAVDALFGSAQRHEHHQGQNWEIWRLETADGGQVEVVIDDTVDRGDLASQEAAALMLDVWRPRFLLLADIGGGFVGRDGLGVGDLVVASSLEYYSLIKEVDGQTETRELPIAAPARGLRKEFARLNARTPNWSEAIPVDRPAVAKRPTPKVLPGQIVVGETLLADPNSPTVAALAHRYKKALAVDMESVGVARAVYGAQQKEIFTQFAILRGISDLIDEKDLDNQETRDNAKPYAAGVAIAAVHAYMRCQPGNNSAARQPLADPPSYRPRYLELLRRVLAARPAVQGPLFRLPLESTKIQIEDSAAPAPGAQIERGEVLDILEHDRLVAIIGKSGVGKSELLNAAARQLAAADDPITVRIDLKSGWSPAWAEAMPDAWYGEHLDPAMDALLNAASPLLTVSHLNDFLTEGAQVVVLVDALNEVPPEIARKIRLTLGQYARKHPNVQVLATDRVAGPDYRDLHWTVLDLPTLDPAETRRVIDAQFGEGIYDQQPDARREILRIPFFLDRALRQGTVEFTSRADLVQRYLQAGGLNSRDSDVVSEIALDLLMRSESILSVADVARLEESGVLAKLLEGGFLFKDESHAWFAHQLIHQYFAGNALAPKPELWRPDVMDAVTFFAASLDGVGMVVKAIPDVAGRDRFLQLVYDWNWRAAVLALSEARAGDRTVSEATEQAILAMAAEKRFDPVEGTRNRINTLLENVEGPTAAEFRELNEEALQAAIAAIDHPGIEWWQEWKALFLIRDPQQLFDDAMIERLVSEMPLVGWMASNALRRAEPPPEVAELVRVLCRSHPRPTAEQRAIRWRILHTLGAWPSDVNAELLFEGVEDEHVWCRYGAVRSLVEMAARTSDQNLRQSVIARLGEKWRGLDPEPLSQLAWASRYETADAAWPAAIQPLIEEVRDAQKDEERERWNRRFENFRRYVERHRQRQPKPA